MTAAELIGRVDAALTPRSRRVVLFGVVHEPERRRATMTHTIQFYAPHGAELADYAREAADGRGFGGATISDVVLVVEFADCSEDGWVDLWEMTVTVGGGGCG